MELTEQQKQALLLLKNMTDDEAIKVVDQVIPICPWMSSTTDLLERLQERGLAPTAANVAAVANTVNPYVSNRLVIYDEMRDAIEDAIDELEQELKQEVATKA